MLESFELVLINMVAIFMISEKLLTLSCVKTNLFSNKSHDVIISSHDVTNKILSHAANYFIDVSM